MEISESETSIPERSSPERSSPNKRMWLWLLLSALLLTGGGIALWRLLSPGASPQAAQQQQPQAFPVQLQRIEQGTIEESSDFVGILQAQQGIDLRPEVEGRVTEIYVREGDRVNRGQPIVQLSPDRTRAEVSAAVANVNAALAARSNAQAELRRSDAERISAAADVELQNTEYERTRYLVEQGVQAQQQLDQVQRDRDAAVASLEAAQEQVRAARATVEQANATFNQAQADAAAARADLSDTLVRAPISGVVGSLPIKLGAYVSVGDTLTTITQNATLDLELAVPIERRNQLQVGLPVELTGFQSTSAAGGSAANPASGSTSNNPSNPSEQALRTTAAPPITGRISFISPTVSPNSQSVLAKASFNNPANLLQDEQRVDARVIWRRRPGVLIPVTAVSRLGGETFVYVAEMQQNAGQGQPQAQPQGQGQAQGQPQMIARQRRVRLGDIQGNNYQVLDGLRSGEQIVVSGLLNLQDGVPIMAVPQNPSGQAPQSGQAPAQGG